MFPPLPPWAGLHPLVVHFPIAVLLVAWLPAALALLPVAAGRLTPGLRVAALLLMVLGSGAAVLAVETGEAASELGDRGDLAPVDVVGRAVDDHEEWGESTRNAFSALTVLYAALLLTPRWLKLLSRPRVALTAHGVFVVLYLTACLLVMWTGHLGGLLVHRYGLRAFGAG
jgi:uncharacterized membrane protein